ncbi:MAG TPA: NADPH-dependent FMN reductase [Luteibacter sp.]|nr:NADPH-dependent FMN reductase [Luteibacter sp.]
MDRLRVLALGGSLRAASTNRMLLGVVRRLAPANIEVSLYDGLGQLPLFNPDIEPAKGLPPAVAALMAEVRASDGLLVACPEYAHGVPGAFKNLLDWLVGMPDFPGKPVALLNAAPRATAAQTALAEILSTMSARIAYAACAAVPVLGGSLDEVGLASDPPTVAILSQALAAFAEAMKDARREARA